MSIGRFLRTHSSVGLEQNTHNVEVVGSSPTGSTNLLLLMEYILFWLYIIVGFCIGVEYIARCSEKDTKTDVPLLLIFGALLLYLWPGYLIYYYYNTEKY